MESAFLEDCLAQGMSLEAIGEIAGKHPSTVSYWLKKHELRASNAARHAPKGSLSKVELESLLESGLTLREIADRLERSVSTVRHWLGRYGLQATQRRRTIPDGSPKRSTMSCRHHGACEFVLEGRGYYRCVRCRAEAVSKRRRAVKRRLVEEAGGKCIICGYSRCQRALEFHHLDPATKKFHLGHQGQSRSLARSREEARKCILLCANCHAEVEAGLIALPVNSKMEGLIRSSTSD
jgi:transposase